MENRGLNIFNLEKKSALFTDSGIWVIFPLWEPKWREIKVLGLRWEAQVGADASWIDSAALIFICILLYL